MISVAPMMDWTDRHCRYFHRLLAPNARLYTEMVTARALLHGDAEYLLRFDPAEHPVAVQLGGSVPDELARAARIAGEFGYDEINLNIGCPSDRVQSGQFGACLMAEPGRVADCIAAMKSAVEIPVTVKTRIGIDDHDDFGFLDRFVSRVAEAGCDTFIVHARKAILAGLSPRENREVPPLRYDRVRQLKAAHPELRVIVNGGITRQDQVDEFLGGFEGVMVGRAAYQNPYFLGELEAHLFGTNLPERETVIAKMLPYIEAQLRQGVRLHSVTRHILGLFAGQPGARRWRRLLSEEACREGAGIEVIRRALEDRAGVAAV